MLSPRRTGSRGKTLRWRAPPGTAGRFPTVAEPDEARIEHTFERCSRQARRAMWHCSALKPGNVALPLKEAGQCGIALAEEGPVPEWGYTMMCEQTGPRELVDDVVAAESAGFDYAVISDHYFPWLEEQGHSPYAWSVLGAAAQATERIPLLTHVTCPIMRYHPAVVAQKAATMGALSDGRFTLGLGAGENLNEHVVGRGWPSADVRHEMFVEAVEIIRRLLDGDYVTWRGRHFAVDSAKLYDKPDQPVPIAIAASGPESLRIARDSADALIAVEPRADLVRGF